MSLIRIISTKFPRDVEMIKQTCAGVLPTPLVAVLLPATGAPIDEPRSRVRARRDLIMAISSVGDV